ncbi:hypothetical protein [Demetria terragena]|uniref:hypothetical protein n=1 Tax=Demetria terragena TaxID=63959 RepID=UPI00035E4B88|nr:hypothetical protein [Demetria terragena]
MSDRIVRDANGADRSAWVSLRASMFRAMGVDEVDDPVWQESAATWFDRRSEDVHIVVVEVDSEVVAATGRRRSPS